ncbi:MAG: vitamin K epoxide reductase family protein [Nanoarchaeota archaeon]
MSNAILIISIIGLVISLYAMIVEKRLENKKSYKPACDITNNISCTKAFSSQYSKITGISNSLIGFLFYLVLIILSVYNKSQFIFYLSFISLIPTIFLAYISFIKMKNLCLVCTAIYILNILLVIISYQAIA